MLVNLLLLALVSAGFVARIVTTVAVERDPALRAMYRRAMAAGE